MWPKENWVIDKKDSVFHLTGQSSTPSTSPLLWESTVTRLGGFWRSGVSHQSESLRGIERNSASLSGPHLSSETLLQFAEFIFLLEERQGFVQTFRNLGEKQNTLSLKTGSSSFLLPSPWWWVAIYSGNGPLDPASLTTVWTAPMAFPYICFFQDVL